MTPDIKPPSVPLAKQGGQTETNQGKDWSWVEPAVWTERMLAALQNGVKGGVWFSLMDKVYGKENLRAAWKQVRANRGGTGVDHVNLAMFERDLEGNLERMHTELKQGTYRPQAVKRVYIPKLGSKEKRPLGIPTVRDRVVQTALRNVLEPIFEHEFAEHSFGFRPKRGAKDALRRVDQLLKNGNLWVVDADLKSYFDTIPHHLLMAQVRRKVTDGRVLGLVEAYLNQLVQDGATLVKPQAGTPQGAVVSPLLANLYLDPLDHLMAQQGFQMARYADDFVVLCSTEAEAHRAMEHVRQWTAQVGLILHPTKSRLVDMEHSDGFDFLGYHFQLSKTDPRKIQRWPRKKSEAKFKEQVRALTKRCNRFGITEIIAKLRPIAQGFYEYFKHSLATTFNDLDGWIRGRLRAVLRKQNRRPGIARGADHQRWPNAYFRQLGFFSMKEAHAAHRQSSRR